MISEHKKDVIMLIIVITYTIVIIVPAFFDIPWFEPSTIVSDPQPH